MHRFRSPLPPFLATNAMHALWDSAVRHALRHSAIRHTTDRISALRHSVRDPHFRPPRLILGAAAATIVTAVIAMAVALAGGGTNSPVTSSGNAATLHASAADAAGQAAPRAVSGQQAAGQQPAASQPQAPAARPAAPAAPAQPAAPAPPAQPYQIYDSVEPEAIPPGHMVATYATGRNPTSAAEMAGRQVMWIDVTGTDYNASALDVEPGNVGPSQAAVWALNRLKMYPNAIAHIYTFQAEWPAVQAAVAATVPQSMQSRIHWWIADPTGVPHMLPGAQATQWYWGPTYDISTAQPGF